MGSASRFDSRSPTSSADASGRPMSQDFQRRSVRSSGVRGSDASRLATSWLGPV